MGSITLHGQLSLSGSRLLPSPGTGTKSSLNLFSRHQCTIQESVAAALKKMPFKNGVPGDDNKRDPERESWPCSVMLPILPNQSISGSRLLPSPGRKICCQGQIFLSIDCKQYRNRYVTLTSSLTDLFTGHLPTICFTILESSGQIFHKC